MSKYQIVQVATLHSGIVEVSDAQYVRRKHALKPIGNGKYEITAPVQFKVGESIGYEGDMPKAMGSIMIDESTAKKAAAKQPKEEKAKAEAERKAAERAAAELAKQKQAVQDEIEQLQILLAAAADEEKAAIEDQIAVKQAELSAIE